MLMCYTSNMFSLFVTNFTWRVPCLFLSAINYLGSYASCRFIYTFRQHLNPIKYKGSCDSMGRFFFSKIPINMIKHQHQSKLIVTFLINTNNNIALNLFLHVTNTDVSILLIITGIIVQGFSDK